MFISEIDRILDGCQVGNLNCQRQLYELYYSYAMSICLAYAPQRDEAAEILNDAFLKALKSIHKFDRKLPFKPWFRRIVINAAIDYFRKNKKVPLYVDMIHAISYTEEAIEFPEIKPEEDVLPMLALLSPGYRIVFSLYVLEEYTHKEIGQLLGISESASRSNLARAVAVLKIKWIEQKDRPLYKEYHHLVK